MIKLKIADLIIQLNMPIKLLTEENQQLRRYTLLASIGILLSMMIGLVRMVQKN